MTFLSYSHITTPYVLHGCFNYTIFKKRTCSSVRVIIPGVHVSSNDARMANLSPFYPTIFQFTVQLVYIADSG